MHGNSASRHHPTRVSTNAAVLSLTITSVILLLSFSPASATRRGVLSAPADSSVTPWVEETLSHDDGTAESGVTGSPGQKVAVGFQAPEWATHVIALELYVMNDQVQNPYDPQAPSTMPFSAWIWRPSADGLPGPPGNPGYIPFPEPYSYPEEAWVTVHFPNAIEITNDYYFPDRKFFVGIEWEHRLNPYVGVDTDPPCAGASFRWNWVTWELREDNVMIRAVVAAETMCIPEIIHVDAAGGGDFLSIQEAVDAASPVRHGRRGAGDLHGPREPLHLIRREECRAEVAGGARLDRHRLRTSGPRVLLRRRRR